MLVVKDSEFAVLKSHVEETKADVKMLVKVITIGNGKPSLLSRMDASDKAIEEINRKVNRWLPDLLDWMNRSKGVLAIVSFIGIGGIVALIRSFI